MTYEYIRLKIDTGDLKGLNGLSSMGWRVVAIVQEPHLYTVEGHWPFSQMENFALLERPLP
jgi:hypothetical protein